MDIYDLSSRNRALLEKYQLCVCAYCLREFNVMKVIDWCDDGMTAICPYCWVDDVFSSPKLCLLYTEEDIYAHHRSLNKNSTSVITFTDEDGHSINANILCEQV
jgi:hypothetical protein